MTADRYTGDCHLGVRTKIAGNCAKCDFSSYIAIVYSEADAVCMVYGMLVLNARILGTNGHLWMLVWIEDLTLRNNIKNILL